MPGSADRLAHLYHVSQLLNSSLELEQVLNTVMDEVITAVRAERGFVMLRETDGSLSFRTARGIDRQTIESPEFQVSRSVVDRVATEGQSLLTGNAQGDAWLSGRASVVGLGLRSILCVPLAFKNNLTGLIYVDNRLRAGIFGHDDLEMLTAIAASAAAAIENARLHARAVEQARLERELQVAHDMQQSLLPASMPRIPGWELAAAWWPAREVAGDFYDIIGPNRRTGLVIGDVCDKGMPAALFMALTRSILRASLSTSSSPASAMAHANRLICADARDGMFVSIFYGRIQTATGDITYVNAGHNPPLLYAAEEDCFSSLAPTGMALGIDSRQRFTQGSVRMSAGDVLLLYTDGVTDATDAHGEAFGVERLQTALHEHRSAPAAQIMAALEDALRAFVGAAPQYDDVTMLVAKRSTEATSTH